MLVFIVKISFSLAVLQTTVMVLVVGPFFPAELKVTFIFPDFPGFTASSVNSGTVQPHEALAVEISKSASPVFVNSKVCSTLSPCLISPKSNSVSLNVITGYLPSAGIFF